MRTSNYLSRGSDKLCWINLHMHTCTFTELPTVTIVSIPPGTPSVDGSNNAFVYPILSSVALTCMVDPSPSNTIDYQWNTTGCYTNINYNGGVPSCFPHGQTTQTVTDNNLTAEDSGIITCSVTIYGEVYTSDSVSLHVSGKNDIYSISTTKIYVIIGIAMTSGSNAIISNNQLSDYSYITERGGTGLLANCVTGLGPTDNVNNTILGGWYFDGSPVTNQECSGDGVRVLDSEYVGVTQLQQCGTFTTTTEGVYTCMILNSVMMQQSMRLGVYFNERSKKLYYQHIILIFNVF